MALNIGSYLAHRWNAFIGNRDPTKHYRDVSYGYSNRPDRPRLTRGNERSIVNALFNRIALDVAEIAIKHVKVDDEGRFLSEISSGLNNCLTIEANIDQTARAYVHDLVISMLDEGVVAEVPVWIDDEPKDDRAFEVLSIRTGQVIEWKPRHVKVRVYNDITGVREDLTLPKTMLSIIENPLYSIVNEPNSTLQRLIRKLNLLDAIDEQSGSGKLDLIIQLPYSVKSPLKRDQAESRRKDIEKQLVGSKYGIAYIDATEHITQLNRPVENNLMKQVEYLTSMLYSQLGFAQSILDNTADEATMLNYYNRLIEPIVSAIVDERKRKWLSKTARTQRQSIMYFRDPFKLISMDQTAKAADTFTRNEIMTSNEVRQKLGMKPSKDPKADQLVNSNISQPTGSESNQSKSTPDSIDVGQTNSEDTNSG